MSEVNDWVIVILFTLFCWNACLSVHICTLYERLKSAKDSK